MKRMAFALVLAACMALVGAIWRMQAISPVRPQSTVGSPVVADANLNWDEAEVMSKKSGTVTLRNTTDAPIRVTDIRFTCGCVNVTRELNGKPERVRELELPPRGIVNVLVELETRGLPGSPVRQRITFLTNRPDQPEIHVESLIKRVTGGVSGVPSALTLGRLVVGGVAEDEVDIVDSAERPRRIRNVTSSKPSLLAVELLATPNTPYLEKSQRIGTVIGRVRLRFHGHELGIHREHALIHLSEEERAPDKVEVTAEVVPPVEFSPSHAVLPRRVKDQDVYEAQISCRSVLGKVEQGRLLDSNSSPVQVTFQPDPVSDTLFVLLSADPALSGKLDGRKLPPLKLQFLVGGKWHDVQIPVSVLR